MQPYKKHMPMEEAQLLSDEAEKMQEQIQGAFDRGADEIKLFRPNKKQIKQMRQRQLKKKNRKQ